MFNKYRLTGLVIAFAVISLFGWWLLASYAAEEDVSDFTAALQKQGWRVETGGRSIGGAPLRIYYNFDRPALATSDGGWRWSAAEAHVRRLLYRSDVFQLGAPGRHELKTPLGETEMTLASAAASLRFGGKGYDDDLLSRLSLVLTNMTAAGAKAERIEAHLGPTKPIETAQRKLFARARALAVGGAASVDLTLNGVAQFAGPLNSGGATVPELTRITLRGLRDAPAALLSFEKESGGRAELSLEGVLERAPGADALLGWRGKLAFVTDDGPAVIAQLGAMGLLDEASKAALTARLASSGRLAGVLHIKGDEVEALDISPQPIPLRTR